MAKKLTEERKARLTALLSEKKRTMWNELCEELFRQTGEGLQPQYELPQDPGDRGLIDLLEDTGLALADIHQKELTQMEEAERKLREGNYGVCEECGMNIEAQRLEVLPFATHCIACQKLQEAPTPLTGVTL